MRIHIPVSYTHLEDTDVVSDHTGLPDNGSRPVVDREIVSDLRTRMDIDTSLRMGHFSNHAGNKGDAQPVQLVRDAIVADSPETGITKNNLVDVLRSGISVESGFSIRCQQACLLYTSIPISRAAL